jgi:hypothetical protein
MNIEEAREILNVAKTESRKYGDWHCPYCGSFQCFDDPMHECEREARRTIKEK